MMELSIPAAMLVGMGLHTSVAMVTDGRFPGAIKGGAPVLDMCVRTPGKEVMGICKRWR